MATAQFRQMYGNGLWLAGLDSSDGNTTPAPESPDIDAWAELLGVSVTEIQSMISQQESRL